MNFFIYQKIKIILSRWKISPFFLHTKHVIIICLKYKINKKKQKEWFRINNFVNFKQKKINKINWIKMKWEKVFVIFYKFYLK